jgi:protein-disulfide isomerase
MYSAAVAKRVRDDEVGGAHSNVITTPTFFINDVRFPGTPDFDSSSAAIAAAS